MSYSAPGLKDGFPGNPALLLKCGKRRHANVIFILLALLMLSGCSGYRGHAYVREGDGSIGPRLPEVHITFTREDGSNSYNAVTNDSGYYSRRLAKTRYRVTAEHPAFVSYDSAPGFFVVNKNTMQTGNIFLHRHQGTVVILSRHAEKASTAINTNLAEDPDNAGIGVSRAARLGELAAKANVNAVFSTEWCRTAQTAQPAATTQGVPLRVQQSSHPAAGLGSCDPPIDASIQVLPSANNTTAELAAHILSNYANQTVFVVGHSNTVPQLVKDLSGIDVCPTYLPLGPNNSCNIPETEYNHLFVVVISAAGSATVSHANYGPP